MREIKIVSMIVLMMIVLSFVPILQGAENAESPIDDEPLWEKDYSEYSDPYIYPTSGEDYYILGREEFAVLNEDGEERWSKTFPNAVNRLPTFKEDRVYLQTGPLIDGGYKLRCLDRDNGTEIWNEKIDNTASEIYVDDDHEIFLTDKGDSDLTKMSSEGDLIWTNDYLEGHSPSSSVSPTDDRVHILYDREDSTDKILSISSEGDIYWELSFDDQLGHLSVIEGTNEFYTYSRDEVYRITLEGEKESVYRTDGENQFRSFRIRDDRKYSIEKNVEANETYLKSIDENGDVLWNTTIENLKDEVGLLSLTVPGNDRIYCQYRIFTRDFEDVYMLKAFNLEGELEWRHEYNESHQFHVISEDGVIVTSGEDGRIKAYQGHEGETGDEIPGFVLPLFSTAAFVAVAIYERKQ